jgi:hypothetical protein
MTMGWFDSDHAGHEGYLIGLVEDRAHGLAAEAFMRRLAYPHDDGTRAVEMLQVGCDCGWRSARFRAPLETAWHPFAVALPAARAAAVEAVAVELWRRHLADPPDLFAAWLDRDERR